MKEKYRYSNFAFYTFVICIAVAAATLTIFGYSSLLSGFQIRGSLSFWIWVWVHSLLFLGFTAFFILLYGIVLWFYYKTNPEGDKESDSNTGNTNNTSNMK
jgi:hypothetical protein